MKDKTRLVVVEWEYLDGIEGMTTRAPSEFDPTVRRIPVRLLDALDAALAATLAAEKALGEAWGKAPEIPNSKYQPPEDT